MAGFRNTKGDADKRAQGMPENSTLRPTSPETGIDVARNRNIKIAQPDQATHDPKRHLKAR